jgi:excisionase family DNA binding protein
MGTRAVAESWISVDDVASHLGINRDTVYKWLQRKKLPGHKAGRLWRFKISEVDQWIRKDSKETNANLVDKKRGA